MELEKLENIWVPLFATNLHAPIYLQRERRMNINLSTCSRDVFAAHVEYLLNKWHLEPENWLNLATTQGMQMFTI